MAGNKNSGPRRRNDAERYERKLRDWHDSIQTTKILNRLQSHVLDDTQMSMSQIKGAELLLKRTLPERSMMDITAQLDGNLTVNVMRYGDDQNTE